MDPQGRNCRGSGPNMKKRGDAYTQPEHYLDLSQMIYSRRNCKHDLGNVRQQLLPRNYSLLYDSRASRLWFLTVCQCICRTSYSKDPYTVYPCNHAEHDKWLDVVHQ